MRFAGTVLILLLATGVATAEEDRLVLGDGQVITGTIVTMNRRDVRIETDGETIRVPRVAIESIERGRSVNAPKAPPRVATPEASAWLDLCVEHLQSEDEDVRRGAEAALRVAGALARPALEKAAAGDDETPPSVARLLALLDRGESRPGRTMERKAVVTGWVSADVMARSLALSDEQVPPFNATIESFRNGADELSRALESGGLEESEADAKFTELRAAAQRELGGTLDETQLERCLRLLPLKLPRS